MTQKKLVLPNALKKLVAARDELAEHYNQANLAFTFDGKLVGDIGEAVAAEYFIVVIDGNNAKGFDGLTSDGKKVQVKASSVAGGAAFRPVRSKINRHISYFFTLNSQAMKQPSFTTVRKHAFVSIWAKSHLNAWCLQVECESLMRKR